MRLGKPGNEAGDEARKARKEAGDEARKARK